MDYVTRLLVYSRAFLYAVLAAFLARPAGALVTTPKLRFSTDPAFAPTLDSVIGDFTPSEANFTGYTAGGYAVTLSAPLNLGVQVVGTEQQILAVAVAAVGPAVFVGNTIYGYWVDDGTKVICAERFAGGLSIPVGKPGDYVAIDFTTPLQAIMNGS